MFDKIINTILGWFGYTFVKKVEFFECSSCKKKFYDDGIVIRDSAQRTIISMCQDCIEKFDEEEYEVKDSIDD